MATVANIQGKYNKHLNKSAVYCRVQRQTYMHRTISVSQKNLTATMNQNWDFTSCKGKVLIYATENSEVTTVQKRMVTTH